MKLILLVLVAGWGVSEAIVCPPGICAAVSCLRVDNCDGMVKNSGYCGCCPVCVKQLGENESCMQSIFIGVPATAECGEGLTCDILHAKCIKKSANMNTRDIVTCATAHQKYMAQQHMLGAEEPKCETDGTYSAVQCEGSRCYCVSPEGQQLGFTVNRSESKNMDCKCARDQHAYSATGLIGKLFSCGPNGNYQNYKCVGSVCWCKDDSGNKVGQSVNIGQLDSLNC
ncbi:thyroglobulin isoform X1 [Patella vulgata]|uniref:thyroglobulin isoform X1 n=1 Tax=Patella vulgata TaxID=6465 RepID=UPI0021804473|nr:thyroglobulin isoform X1 [Patella vulgata]